MTATGTTQAQASPADTRALVLPIYCPIPPASHPSAEHIDQRAIAWMRSYNFCGNAHIRERLEAAKVGGLVASMFPDSSDEALEAMAKLHLWSFAFDDEIERLATTQLTAVADQHYGFMRLLDAPHSSAMDGNPYADAFKDYCGHLRRLATPTVWRRWVERCRAFVSGVVWACVYRRADTPPAPDTVTTIRMLDAGGPNFGTGMIEFAGGFEIAADDLALPQVRAMTDMAEVILAWDNDIYSHPIESENNVEKINLVTSLAEHNALSTHQALIQAVHMRNQAMWCYMAQRHRMESANNAPLRRYLTGLDTLIRGHLDWALRVTCRYETTRRNGPVFTLYQEPTTNLHGHDLTQPVDLPSIRWWWNR